MVKHIDEPDKCDFCHEDVLDNEHFWGHFLACDKCNARLNEQLERDTQEWIKAYGES